MVRTRVGYAGGSKPAPTYRSIGDHTEALQVDFDPQVISFERLLEVFWEEHNPCGQRWSTQYKAILFYSGPEQHRDALASSQTVHQQLGKELTTELVELDRFWVAEDYHQKYSLRRQSGLAEGLLRSLSSEAKFRDSPVAAKLNAFCAGDLDRPALDRALAQLGYRISGDRRSVEKL